LDKKLFGEKMVSMIIYKYTTQRQRKDPANYVELKWHGTKRLASHKKAIVQEQRKKKAFCKRPQSSSFSSETSKSENIENQQVILNNSVPDQPEKPTKAEIDPSLMKYFCRTGIPFRVADSAAFQDFVRNLNQETADETMTDEDGQERQ
jgi:hypothetical protein